MDNSTFQRVRQLFDALVGLTPEQRAAEIAAREDLDDAIRQRLCGLLELDAHAVNLTAASALRALRRGNADRLGMRVGAYRIDAPLGAGGMGEVYRAHRVDGDIEQHVAIKIARRDLLDDTTLARFRLERQVLALLQHPSIAAMYDVGELADGTPYLVMEYVEGRLLLEDVATRALDLDARIALFLQLCDAVAYAHQHLIVHRDIKPGNVFVTADGRPKLLDFGIAKPLRPRLGAVDVEQTAVAQRFFSLRNVAPEQLRGDPVDVTCDVYGLGSVLYELLCGRPLYDFDDMTLGQIERCIAQNDPLPPSERADAAAGVRRARLPRDLDAVTLQALRRDPGARYPSVDALAADLRRYAAGYPVLARQAPPLYRLDRFVRRHRLALATAGLFIAVVVAGAAVWLQQYYSTLAERDRAESVTRTIVDALDVAAPAGLRGKEISARELFEHVGTLVLAEDGEQGATRVQLAITVARIQHYLGRPEHALALLARIEPEVTGVPIELRSEFELERAAALLSIGAEDETVAAIDDGADAAPNPDLRRRWLLLAADTNSYRENHARALAIFRELLADPSATRAQQWEARSGLANALFLAGRGGEALDAARALLADKRAYYRSTHPDLQDTLQQTLYLARMNGMTREAEQLSIEALATCRATYDDPDHYACIVITNQRAATLAEAGHLAEAETLAYEGLALALRHAGTETELSVQFRYTLAEILKRRGDAGALAGLRDTVHNGARIMSQHSFTLMSYRLSLIVELLRLDQAIEAGREIDAAQAVIARDRVLPSSLLAQLIELSRLLQPDPRSALTCRSFAWLATAIDSAVLGAAAKSEYLVLLELSRGRDAETPPWQSPHRAWLR